MKRILYTNLENFKKEVAPYFVKKGITPTDYVKYGLEIKGELRGKNSIVKISLEVDNNLRLDLEKLTKSSSFSNKGSNETGTGTGGGN